MAEKYTTTFKVGGLPPKSNGLTELNDSTPRMELGTRIYTVDDDYGIKCYKYVKFNATGTAGLAYRFSDVYNREVTSAITTATANKVAGVAIGTVTSGNYGVVQCLGYYATVATDTGDDIVAGDNVILKNGTTGQVDRMAAGTAPTLRPLGVAVADDTASTVAVFIDVE